LQWLYGAHAVLLLYSILCHVSLKWAPCLWFYFGQSAANVSPELTKEKRRRRRREQRSRGAG